MGFHLAIGNRDTIIDIMIPSFSVEDASLQDNPSVVSTLTACATSFLLSSHTTRPPFPFHLPFQFTPSCCPFLSVPWSTGVFGVEQSLCG